MLNMLQEWNLPQFGRYSSRYYHHLAEVMKAAFADRSVYLGDPAFVNVPVEGLTSLEYAAQLSQRIESEWEKSRQPGNPYPFMADPPDSLMKAVSGGHTSHLSVMDAEGNMVALTSSVNTHFGSKLILEGTGIFLNNTMNDFSLQPGHPNVYGLVGSEANSIAPGKRPLSSMTPTLVLREGKPFLAIGAAGGPRIITGTLQGLLNVVDFRADIAQALHDPRIHHQWAPDYLFVSPQISPDAARALDRMGHIVIHDVPGSVVQGVLLDPESGLFYGAADPRGMGSAAGVR
jgi:gamma-glutamyltranspeptidase/glutathione hydrolase